MTSMEADIYMAPAEGELHCRAAFVVNIESGADEPHTWSNARYVRPEVTSATLESVKLGGYWMPRAALEQWIGTAEIDQIEREALDDLHNQFLDGVA